MYEIEKDTVVGRSVKSDPDFLVARQEWVEVAYDDCGEKGKQPHLVLGENYEMPAELSGSTAQRSCNFGGKVIYAFDKMDIHADYRMEVTFLADSERIIEIVADGNPVCESIHLPAGEVVKKKSICPVTRLPTVSS